MRTVNASRNIEAPSSAIWDVLANFANIADWSGGVRKSRATSDQTEGIGATRHCDLSPAGTLEETVREWEVGEKMVISIDSATKLPLERAVATFTLASADDFGTTRVDLKYEYETKWGLMGKIVAPVLDRQFTKGFNGFLADLETAASSND